ncbi:NAD(P)/FAD-dependent oxidoreductase [Roseibium aestuarii]|uniref:NAD(P)/FAD-dependent oxidoreductase n=1 Tax=Roseibium aestuarii TaxID=2600299 RepID=A0ABW4K120_9HYPH|nr:FAD-binding oxidoreductase [Roseibium aestuarii]
MTTRLADVAIIGGAAIGSSLAYHLASRDDAPGRILVIEADPTYQVCASARSAASIRQQFSSAVNIEISLHGIAFMRDAANLLSVDGEAPLIELKEGGYLFLATPDKLDILRENHALQTRLGADIAWYSAPQLASKYPWLETGDLAAGCHGTTGEGWFDGYGLMQGFRRKARSLGVDYVSARAETIRRDGEGWLVTLSTGESVSAGTLVNCAGASGGAELCAQIGLDVPIRRRKRCVFTFECRAPLDDFPMLIDTTGAYARPEGPSGFICGIAPDDANDPDVAPDDFEVDWALFEETLWPTLAGRVPAFESLRPGRAWAGQYDMNLFDHNAFVGSVPGQENLFMALGFSGHGLQQSPAIGRGLSELVMTGGYETLDLSPLRVERLAENIPLIERNVV